LGKVGGFGAIKRRRERKKAIVGQTYEFRRLENVLKVG
jgi:hypothetical protein